MKKFNITQVESFQKCDSTIFKLNQDQLTPQPIELVPNVQGILDHDDLVWSESFSVLPAIEE